MNMRSIFISEANAVTSFALTKRHNKYSEEMNVQSIFSPEANAARARWCYSKTPRIFRGVFILASPF